VNRRAFLLAASAAALLVALPALSAPSERYQVDIRVIEATPGSSEKQVVDPKLKAFARDFKNLPFQSLQLRDAHSTSVQAGERVTLEFPSDKKKRILVVAAHGKQSGGKLRFQLTIDSLKFDTLVAVPERGTIVVAGPRHAGKTLMFALTARTR
jgi:hypothetical protein